MKHDPFPLATTVPEGAPRFTHDGYDGPFVVSRSSRTAYLCAACRAPIAVGMSTMPRGWEGADPLLASADAYLECTCGAVSIATIAPSLLDLMIGHARRNGEPNVHRFAAPLVIG